jgi:DNA replication protein DnaC
MAELQDQAIRQHCKTLRMPTIGGQFARLAEAATREGQSHVGYLEALLAAEMEERESRAITRLLHEAKLPRMKTLEAFEFDRSGVSAGQLRTLAEGDYVTKAEPILLSARLAPARRTWRQGYVWLPAASGDGCGSPRRRR